MFCDDAATRGNRFGPVFCMYLLKIHALLITMRSQQGPICICGSPLSAVLSP